MGPDSAHSMMLPSRRALCAPRWFAPGAGSRGGPTRGPSLAAAAGLACALVATDAAAQARIVDVLASQQDVSVSGARRASFLTDNEGLAVADIDHDGAPDLIFGAIVDQIVGVKLGPLTSGTRLDLAAGSPDILLADPRYRSFFGQTLLVADVSGDGVNDLVVGASRDGLAPGEVDVFFGPIARGTSVADAPPTADAVLIGISASDLMGARVRSGDFDGDGLADLAIAAPRARGPGDVATSPVGEVYIVFGPIPRGTRSLASVPADVTVYGARRSSLSSFGPYLAAGDATGDGIDELVLTDDLEPPPSGPATVGAVHVIFGRARAAWPASIDFQATESDYTIRSRYRSLAGRVVQVGDVSGDGTPDLLVSVPEAPAAGRRVAGEVQVFLGPLAAGTLIAPTPDARVLGADTGDVTGDALQVADLSGDGIPDLAIGTTHGDGPGNRDRTSMSDVSTGEAAVVIGPILRGDVVDLRTDTDLLLTGRGGDDALGHVVALGDLSGDGVNDLAAGTIWSDGFNADRPSAGEAHVVFSMLAGACRVRMSELSRLLVAKSAGDRFRLTLDPTPRAADPPANVYAGSIALLHQGNYDHRALADGCDIVGGTVDLGNDASPGTYWLVVAACRDSLGLHEGPLGNAVARSTLTPRPSAADLGLPSCP